MNRVALVGALATLVMAVLGVSADEPRAQPSCKRYTVNVPLLHVRKDPSSPGGYIAALIKGEVACVADVPPVGVNAYIVHKTLPDGREINVGGWANINFMSAIETTTAPPLSTATTADTDGDSSLQEAQSPLMFDQPIPYGASQVRGKTLKELAEGIPLFSPIQGLPDNVWKKNCTECHKWTRQALCDQGTSYIPRAAEIFRHPHPYGGPYKLSLMRWAATGCK